MRESSGVAKFVNVLRVVSAHPRHNPFRKPGNPVAAHVLSFVSFLFFAGKQVVYDNNNTHICTRLCVCVLQIESLAVLNVG